MPSNRKFHLAATPRPPFSRGGAFVVTDSFVITAIVMLLLGAGEPGGAVLALIVGITQLLVTLVIAAVTGRLR